MIFLISYSNQEIYYNMTLLYWYYIIILIDILTVLNKHINTSYNHCKYWYSRIILTPKRLRSNCLHILIKNPQIFNSSPSIIYENESLLYHIFARNIEVQRFTHKSEQIKYKSTIFEYSMRLHAYNLSPTLLENRELIIDNETLTTDTCLPLLFQPFEQGEGRGGRGRVCLDLGLREDLPVTSTREFRAKYLFIRLWYA